MKKFTVFFPFTTLLLFFTVGFTSLPAAASSFPGTISLPKGFQPEGIAIGHGTTFYVGSLADGSIFKGDLRTGEGEVIIVPGLDEGGQAVGLCYDYRWNYLFVAGGLGGDARVYDPDSGELLEKYRLATGLTLINGVICTKNAVYFTDSFNPVFYRVQLKRNGLLPNPEEVEEIPLSGDFQFIEGEFNSIPILNSNGIEASEDGRHLFIVNYWCGTLYRVDSITGEALEVDIGYNDSCDPFFSPLFSGDGLILQGRKLYVVQNLLNQIAVVKFYGDDFTSGEIVEDETIIDLNFANPSTAGKFGSFLYTVNARYSDCPPPPVTPPECMDKEFEIVKVKR